MVVTDLGKGQGLEFERDLDLEVVLATCNGALHLDAQLQSLWGQERRPNRLLVFDDGSSDETTTILERWCRAHPGWLQQLSPSPRKLGPRAAFAKLLQASRARYVALCDQDDVWRPERLSTGLALLRQEERKRGGNPPLLLHSDALLIDANGDALPQALWQWHRVSGNTPPLWSLALHNQVTGCTVVCNRALLERALPIPDHAVLHDWWLAMVACRLHGLIACPQKLLLHRRHGSNASGPVKRNAWPTPSLAARIQQRWRQWQSVRAITPDRQIKLISTDVT